MYGDWGTADRDSRQEYPDVSRESIYHAAELTGLYEKYNLEWRGSKISIVEVEALLEEPEWEKIYGIATRLEELDDLEDYSAEELVKNNAERKNEPGRDLASDIVEICHGNGVGSATAPQIGAEPAATD